MTDILYRLDIAWKFSFPGKVACAETVAAQPQQKNVHKNTLWYNSIHLLSESVLLLYMSRLQHWDLRNRPCLSLLTTTNKNSIIFLWLFSKKSDVYSFIVQTQSWYPLTHCVYLSSCENSPEQRYCHCIGTKLSDNLPCQVQAKIGSCCIIFMAERIDWADTSGCLYASVNE